MIRGLAHRSRRKWELGIGSNSPATQLPWQARLGTGAEWGLGSNRENRASARSPILGCSVKRTLHVKKTGSRGGAVCATSKRIELPFFAGQRVHPEHGPTTIVAGCPQTARHSCTI